MSSEPSQMTPPGPRHVAIVMDGNGRWAEKRKLPRTVGHQQGVKSARAAVESAATHGVEVLTLFAFSSENWQRPKGEVDRLMELFVKALDRETPDLHKNNVQLRFIGEVSGFSKDLRERISRVESMTADNDGLKLVIAANYGGRWDILQAARKAIKQQLKSLPNQPLEIADLARHMCLSELPEPDLFIRTGGERRISNFLLWQLAYTELWFTDTLWPDFNDTTMRQAIDDFAGRQRRFGRTAKQVSSA